MLSPHEFSTLLLVRDSPEQIDTKNSHLFALVTRELVVLAPSADGSEAPLLTQTGQRVLCALGTDHKTCCKRNRRRLLPFLHV
ncbi:MAG TPA: hypothetical protein VGN31_21415 [Paraburkholderia sp.]|jgi:hypothetical protein